MRGMNKKYQIIYADPPWKFFKKGGRGRAEKHYPTMSVESIKNLGGAIREMDAQWLFLWATCADLPRAFDVITAWGFTYKTMFTWVKPQMGIGNYFRTSTEHLLLGVKKPGSFSFKGQMNWIIAPRQKHSQKPEEVYDIIERCVGKLPRIELFARTKREGWDVWGNEVESDIELTPKVEL